MAHSHNSEFKDFSEKYAQCTFEKMLLDNIFYLKISSPNSYGFIDNWFKLYTLNETRLNFKIPINDIKLISKKWSIFNDQYLDSYHSYRKVTHITGKLSLCFRISILRLNWSDTRNIIKIAHFRGQRTTVWLIKSTWKLYLFLIFTMLPV